MAENIFCIAGKVAVITGAGGILGGELVKYLAKAGVKIAALDLRYEAVAPLQTESVEPFECNVLSEQSLNEVSTKIIARFGRIDILINAAGGNMPGATIAPSQNLFDLKMDEYSKVLDLNLKGTLLPIMTFAKAMAAQHAGVIINFSSMSATQPLSRVLGYGNAKAAIDNLTRALAYELAAKFGEHIRINAIAPGFFITNQNRALLTNPDGSYTARGNTVIAKTPLGRFGTPEEILGCIHFLISDAAKFVTGAVIPVDGGFSAFSGV